MEKVHACLVLNKHRPTIDKSITKTKRCHNDYIIQLAQSLTKPVPLYMHTPGFDYTMLWSYKYAQCCKKNKRTQPNLGKNTEPTTIARKRKQQKDFKRGTKDIPGALLGRSALVSFWFRSCLKPAGVSIGKLRHIQWFCTSVLHRTAVAFM